MCRRETPLDEAYAKFEERSSFQNSEKVVLYLIVLQIILCSGDYVGEAFESAESDIFSKSRAISDKAKSERTSGGVQPPLMQV